MRQVEPKHNSWATRRIHMLSIEHAWSVVWIYVENKICCLFTWTIFFMYHTSLDFFYVYKMWWLLWWSWLTIALITWHCWTSSCNSKNCNTIVEYHSSLEPLPIGITKLQIDSHFLYHMWVLNIPCPSKQQSYEASRIVGVFWLLFLSSWKVIIQLLC